MRGAHHRSDRVSALSEAFHHIFVAVCTPALQCPTFKTTITALYTSGYAATTTTTTSTTSTFTTAARTERENASHP